MSIKNKAERAANNYVELCTDEEASIAASDRAMPKLIVGGIALMAVEIAAPGSTADAFSHNAEVTDVAKAFTEVCIVSAAVTYGLYHASHLARHVFSRLD